MQKSKIKDSIKKLPNAPGVYLFKDINNRILYVGKALNLQKRVKSYFDNKIKELRIKNLLNNVDKIDYEKVNTELEALLLEAKLIKGYRPKYNVILKDDKRYLYLGITKDVFPRVFLLRQPEKDAHLLDWFGPFPSAGSLREVFRALRRIFPFRSCKRLPKRTCLYFELKLCSGLCQYPRPKEYQKSINKIRNFMSGKIRFLLQSLKKEMGFSSKNLDFEKAQRLKIQIEAIENILGRFKKVPEAGEKKKQLDWIRKILIKFQGIEPLLIHRLEVYDVSNLGKKIIVGSMAVFIEGEPDKSEYRQFNIHTKTGGDAGALREIIGRRFKNRDWLFPQLILIDGGKSQISAVYEVLSENHLHLQIAILGLTKEKETLIIPVLDKNKIVGWKEIKKTSKTIGLPILQHARDESHRFAQRYYRKLSKKTLFAFLGKNKN